MNRWPKPPELTPKDLLAIEQEAQANRREMRTRLKKMWSADCSAKPNDPRSDCSTKPNDDISAKPNNPDLNSNCPRTRTVARMEARRFEASRNVDDIERDLIAFLRANANESSRAAIAEGVPGSRRNRSVAIANLLDRGIVTTKTVRYGRTGRPTTLIQLLV